MERRLFYISGTSEFRESLERLSSGHQNEVLRTLDELAQRWEEGSDLNGEYIQNEIYCIRRSGTDVEYRLFIKKLNYPDENGLVTVMVPLAVVRRDEERKYQALLERTRSGNLNWTEDEFKEIQQSCAARLCPKQDTLPEVPGAVREFLYTIQGAHEKSVHLQGDDIVIYESYSFCKWTLSLEDTQLRLVHEKIFDIIKNPPTLTADQCIPCEIEITNIWQATFYYKIIWSERSCLLFVCCEDDKESHDVRRAGQRAYPSYVLYDRELWIAIQREQAISLALSPEEEQIIEDVLKKQQLPVFISGRAGSGKSTILYYIFSNYWYYMPHFRDKMIFLTYTNRLRESASDLIRRITELLALADSRDDRNNEQAPVKTMRDFLFNLIGNDAEEQYPEHMYLDFHKFRQLLSQNHNKTISEDICWHVIRTYIKGYYPDTIMTPNAYQEIPERDKTVTVEEFNQAYNIYKWFCENHRGYWDELDLVRKLLERDRRELPEYYVIFCDEAQDFTRVEFELMFRLSFASRYNFMYTYPTIPIVLAGDPLQTINPTGFRPEALRALLHNLVVERIQCAGRRADKHYYELVHNYRCSGDITRLSNLINLLRATLLAEDPKQYGRPQSPWREGTSIPPGIVPLSYFNQKTALNSFHIIIHPDLKEQIATNDEDVLRTHQAIATLVQQEEPNLWTPLQIKGLEKDDVVVYGFGEILHRLLSALGIPQQLSLLDNGVRQRISEITEQSTKQSTDARIRLGYFFSNLYVAITRSINRLYIVDTPNGCSTLWNLLMEGRWESLLSTTTSPEWSKRDNFGGVVPEEKIDTRPIDPQEEAAESEKRWKEERNTDAARRAVRWYQKLGDLQKAYSIQAEIYEYEQKWNEAAESYEQAKDIERALRCYFRSSGYQRAKELLDNHREIRTTPLNNWIKKWVTVRIHIDQTPPGVTQQEQEQWLDKEFFPWLDYTEEILNSHATGIDRSTIREEVKRIIDEVDKNLKKEVCFNYRDRLIATYDGLLKILSTDLRHSIIQRLKNEYWNDGRYQQFIETCDKYPSGEDESRYLRAQAEVRGFPEGLKYLIHQKARHEAVQFWKAHGRQLVVEAVELIEIVDLRKELVSQGEMAAALEIAIRYSSPDLVIDLLDTEDTRTPRKELVAVLQSLLSLADDAILTFLENLLVACIKMGSRKETLETLHRCIQVDKEAKQIIGKIIEFRLEDFLIREILASEMRAPFGSDDILQSMRLVSYLLNGISEHLDVVQPYSKTIEEFMYKFSGRIYKTVQRRKLDEARALIDEIDYLHDITKFRLASLISEPRRAAIIRDLLQAKDLLKEQIEAGPSAEESPALHRSLAGEGFTYRLYVHDGQLSFKEDDRAYYLSSPNIPIIVRLLKHEAKILCVNTETGDIKSYSRFPRKPAHEKLWDYGESELDSAWRHD